MSLWTFVKLLAAVAVIAAVGFTGMFAYHMAVRPMGGVFEKIVPNPAVVINAEPDPAFAESVNAAVMPDVDPGETAFQKAHELIALGKLAEARDKLNTVVNIFPTSSSAPSARHIVGEMNLDDILSTTQMAGKQTHIVKRGDSFLGIAARYKTTLDCIVNLNGLQELKNLVPGEELLVMPLEYRLLIEPQHQSLSLWDGGRFICEYPIVHLAAAGKLTNLRSTIGSKTGQLDARRSKPDPKAHAKPASKLAGKAKTKVTNKTEAPAETTAEAAAEVKVSKAIQLAKLPLQIRAYAAEDTGARGIFLNPVDMEELFLLTRVGNIVEIRLPAR
ncbi:MAG: LysM peptidoglycan-binding domain-containing protein [Verrucomicrobia bacterium]|nr:MAG: LysM peptidoglycan-binding domain-containing protein [Verrucomicrobiota bacterium]